MFGIAYKHLMAPIAPSDELMRRTLDKAQQAKCSAAKICGLPKPVVVMVLVLLALLLATPVLATTIRAFYQLTIQSEPATHPSSVLEGIADEDNGIRLEVQSVDVADNVAQIVFSLQDFTDNRLDATSSLGDYFLGWPGEYLSTCQLVEYEPLAQKATFLLTISQWEQQKITGGEIILAIRQLLSRQTVYDNRPIDIVCSALPMDSETQVVALSGFVGEEHKMQETVLLPGEPKAPLPVKNIEFTALGYVDSRLHLQIAIDSPMIDSNHGYVYFMDAAGNTVSYNECYIFTLPANGGRKQRDYYEFVFDIAPDKLAEYSLYGYFVTTSLVIEGDWCVSFSLKD